MVPITSTLEKYPAEMQRQIVWEVLTYIIFNKKELWILSVWIRKVEGKKTR